ncbi:MAG: peptidoglycan binding domain-containing protein [Mobilitalea sp.]
MISISSIKKKLGQKALEVLIIVISVVVLIYFLISLYFSKHYFFHTIVNGVDVSLKSYTEAEHLLEQYVNDYELMILGRTGNEKITRQQIGLSYQNNNQLKQLLYNQSKPRWVMSLFGTQYYNIENLYQFNKGELLQRIEQLRCMTENYIEPKNVSFHYNNGYYEIEAEINGTKIIKGKLISVIQNYILSGKKELNLSGENCYEDPIYTLASKKTLQTANLLNRYVTAKITYLIDDKREIIDGRIINLWLTVNEELDVEINKTALKEYVKALAKKYDTVGINREFRASTGKFVTIKGGLYGWKINKEEEQKALRANIEKGEVINREPVYIQRALSREGNEIGDTYVEINITRQMIWFYKDGKLITQGQIVTGNPNKGHATVVGAYMLNYKQKGSVLSGPGYRAEVTYWMPFYGNIGIHDATWRYAFGGVIYKTRGSHGCVNAPKYVAKKIFENIEPGIPIICYEEEKSIP